MDHPLFACMPSHTRSMLKTPSYPIFEQLEAISCSLVSYKANKDVDVNNMRKRENSMSESGWTTYLDDSSWDSKDNSTHLVVEHTGCKELSEITESIEHIDSSIASDASSGPVLHQLPLPHHELDQSPHPVSYPTKIRRLQQYVEYDAFCSTTDEKPRKNSKIRRVENNGDALFEDTATSSLRCPKAGLSEAEGHMGKRALDRMPT